MDGEFDPEQLRPLQYISHPDPRSAMWVRIDRVARTSRPIELADHYDDIAALTLHTGVPADVSLQFETARNLYLFAWYVYRFYPVAEHHSLACLELALRDRLKDDIRLGKVKAGSRRPMLRALLKHAIDRGIIRNEGFQMWRNRGELNARARVESEKFREMLEKKLTEISWDDSEVQVTAEDLNWDYVNVLVGTLPYIRNEYAHGSTNLHNQVLHTVQIVSEIINQLYEVPDT